MIEVNEASFEREVIQASFTQPVLVDFWAPWCGPCRALGPTLERVEADLAGQVRLVKINSDENPQLSARFQIRSIPFVALFKDGQQVDSFVGARPAGQILGFLDPHLPKAGDEHLREAREHVAQGRLDEAAQAYATALAVNPAQDPVRAEYVRLLIRLGRAQDAAPAFEPLRRAAASDLGIAALARLLEATQALEGIATSADAEAQLRQKFSQSGSLDDQFRLAQWLMLRERWSEAMDECLLIIQRDRRFNDDAPRKTILAIFELCGDAQLVGTYRRKLSAGLY